MTQVDVFFVSTAPRKLMVSKSVASIKTCSSFIVTVKLDFEDKFV